MNIPRFVENESHAPQKQKNDWRQHEDSKYEKIEWAVRPLHIIEPLFWGP